MIQIKISNGIYLIFANIGAGKTTYLAKLAQKELKRIEKGKSKFKYIISDTPISGVRYYPDIREILKTHVIKDTLILIDEGGTTYNNRMMKMTHKEIEYFKLIRHYKSAAVVVSQSYEDVDITLRRLYKKMYLITNMGFFSIIKPISKYVMISEDDQIIDGYVFDFFIDWRIFFKRPYFKFFNSYHVPEHKSYPIAEIKEVKRYEKKNIIFNAYNSIANRR